MDFYSIILIIASVILVIALAGIGIAVTNGTYNASFPSYINPCPDFWETTKNPGGGYTCNANTEDARNKGSSNISTYTTTGDLCTDYKWANNNNILWDGISNNRARSTCSTD